MAGIDFSKLLWAGVVLGVMGCLFLLPLAILLFRLVSAHLSIAIH
jgi:hypothetical protein